MPHDPLKLLHDIGDAAELILDQTRNLTLAVYEGNRMLRGAVERSFTIIGETISRLTRADLVGAQALGNYPQIIGFRNVVVHGYDVLEDAIVWGIVQNEIPKLIASARSRIEHTNEHRANDQKGLT